MPPAKPEVALLVYRPLKQRRQDNTFDGNDNVGALVIKDVLERAGIPVGFCTPGAAHRYRVVLVSLTSTHDVYAYYRQVALRPEWQPGVRRFRVLAGGFGMQNPLTIRHYLDYAAFGRYEAHIVSVVQTLLGGGHPAAPGLTPLPDIEPVTIQQAPQLYPHAIELGGRQRDVWQETFTGCPLKCKFCHYTYARQHQGTDEAYGSYVQTTLTGGSTPEVTWEQVVTWPQKAGRLRAAIDGSSKRLRYIYGKRISPQDIVDGINNVGQYEGITTLLVYNIVNFPTETEADTQELEATLHRAQPQHRVIVVLHSTPFRPSLATPMQWEPVTLWPDWSQRRAQVIVERPELRAVHSFTLETPYTHLLSVVAERATPQTDELFHALCFAPALQKGRMAERLAAVQAHFDLTPYLRAYELDEPHPGWFLHSYLRDEQIKRIATKMRQQIARSVAEPGWTPGRSSLVRRAPLA